MADYYPLIARAIAGLDANSTGEQRRAIYERARTALIAQLRGVSPALSESEITRERLTLEEAIRKVEQEAAQRARGARTEALRGRGGDALKGAAARSVAEASTPAPERAGNERPPLRTERERDRTRPNAEREGGPLIRPRSAEPPAADFENRPQPELHEVVRNEQREPLRSERRDRAPLFRRGESGREQQAREPASREGMRGFRDVVADADELGGAAHEANRAARRTYANVPSPTPEFDRIEPSLEDRAAEQFQPSVYGDDDRRQEPPPRTRQRAEPKRQRERQQPPARPAKLMRGFPIGRALAIVAVLIVAGLIASQWQKIRSFSTMLFSSTPTQQQVPAKTADDATSKPKISDRVGQPSPQAPVAQRVVLYDEDPGDPNGKQYVGQVVWRTDNVGGTNGQPSDVAIRADVEVPDRKFKMTFLIRRNTDSSLPASHTAELTFTLPPDFAGGGIDNVPGILMKSNEQSRGTPLSGLAVKVTDGFFLIGLSNVDTDRSRNIQLLKERSWFDLPLVYTNKRRAIIAMEKGPPGERAFNDAFAAWGQ